ncbi:MAG: hypothetical protein QXG65_01710 [Thermoplasmata archaeon]
MRGSFPPPAHRPRSRPSGGLPTIDPFGSEPAGGPDPFSNRPCYEFNPRLASGSNDRRCVHCRHYLTPRCPEIDEFLDDVDDLGPE